MLKKNFFQFKEEVIGGGSGLGIMQKLVAAVAKIIMRPKN